MRIITEAEKVYSSQRKGAYLELGVGSGGEGEVEGCG